MAYKIIISPDAENDLRNIGLYIGRDSPKKASEWVEMLENRARSLDFSPWRGRAYGKKHRMLVVKRGYKIFYRVNEEKKEVTIVSFRSPYRQDPKGL